MTIGVEQKALLIILKSNPLFKMSMHLESTINPEVVSMKLSISLEELVLQVLENVTTGT